MALSAGTRTDADEFSRALRGFGPVGLLAVLVIFLGNGLFVPLSALLVLAWTVRSGTPFAAIGFRKTSGWPTHLAVGILAGVLVKLLFKSLLMPALGAPPVNTQFAHVTGNAAALLAMIAWIVVGAGFGEETVYRGFLFERLRALLGAGEVALGATILLSSLLFGVVHLASQGIYGVVQSAALGVLLGVAYLRAGSLWLPMALHVSFDMTALFLIYTGTESAISTYFIK